MRFFILLLAGCGQVGMDETVDSDPHAYLTLDPNGEISFGKVSPHGHSEEEQVTLTANGDSSLGVQDVWIESKPKDVFYFESDLPFPKNLHPGDSVPLTIRFRPDSTGSFKGTLIIEREDGTLIERNLTGSGCNDGDQDGDCSP